MFPIGDEEVRNDIRPWITWLLIALNAAVFAYQLLLTPPELENFYRNYAVIPAELLQGNGVSPLLTSMFIHGGWAHILGNLLFLWVFGDNVEAIMGKLTYLAVYLAGGIVASLTHILFNPDSLIPSLGASGAIAAILGAYILMFPHSHIRVLLLLGFYATITRVTALLFLGIWFITQLFNGVASLGIPTAQTSGVAVWAHIGGFVFGMLIGSLFRTRARQFTGPQAF